jgi:hypothetical protein
MAPMASRKPRRAPSRRRARAPTAKDRAAEFAHECLAPEGEADLRAIQAPIHGTECSARLGREDLRGIDRPGPLRTC